MTADPYQASGGAGNPGSWNRYPYVGGDPVNFNDPRGLAAICVSIAPGKVSCQIGDSVTVYADPPKTPPGGLGPFDQPAGSFEGLLAQELAPPLFDVPTPPGPGDLDWVGEILDGCEREFNTPEYRQRLAQEYVTQEFHEFLVQDLPLELWGGAVSVGGYVGAGFGSGVFPGPGTVGGAVLGSIIGAAMAFDLAVMEQIVKIPVQLAYYEMFNLQNDVRRQIDVCVGQRVRQVWDSRP